MGRSGAACSWERTTGRTICWCRHRNSSRAKTATPNTKYARPTLNIFHGMWGFGFLLMVVLFCMGFFFLFVVVGFCLGFFLCVCSFFFFLHQTNFTRLPAHRTKYWITVSNEHPCIPWAYLPVQPHLKRIQFAYSHTQTRLQ